MRNSFRKQNKYRLMEAKKIIKHFKGKTPSFLPDCIWNLDQTIAKFIVPRLEYYKEKHCGYPSELTEESWNDVLDGMLYSFRLLTKSPFIFEKEYEKEKFDKGLSLFAEYLTCLWD